MDSESGIRVVVIKNIVKNANFLRRKVYDDGEKNELIRNVVEEIWDRYIEDDEADFCMYMAERWGLENTKEMSDNKN